MPARGYRRAAAALREYSYTQQADLAYSDQVARGDTGEPRPMQREGRPQPSSGC